MPVQNQDWEKMTKREDDFPIGKVSNTGSKENQRDEKMRIKELDLMQQYVRRHQELPNKTPQWLNFQDFFFVIKQMYCVSI